TRGHLPLDPPIDGVEELPLVRRIDFAALRRASIPGLEHRLSPRARPLPRPVQSRPGILPQRRLQSVSGSLIHTCRRREAAAWGPRPAVPSFVVLPGEREQRDATQL